MEIFRRAISMKLTHDGMYLVANDDKESVSLEREGSSENAAWGVEFVPGAGGKEDKTFSVRFRSRYDRYLTASEELLREGSRERKVLQTLQRDEPCVHWEPVRDDFYSWRFRTPSGSFLRRNWGLPPVRNPVTHDVPRRMRIHKVLWDVEVVEAMPKPSVSYPLPLPVNVNGGDLSSPESSPTTVSPSSTFGKGEEQLAWPLPRPPPVSSVGRK